MVDLNPNPKQIKICIPVLSIDDIQRFHQSIINVLNKVDLDHCGPELYEDIITVYELLRYFQMQDVSISRNTRYNITPNP